METAIILVYSVLIAAVTMWVLLWLCTFLTLRMNYKYYKATADALTKGTYVYNEYSSKYADIVYYRKPGDNSLFTKDEILFFENGSIKLLGKSAYIHEAAFTYFDPYTNYWRRKIVKIFMKLEAERTSNAEDPEQLKQI